MWAQPDNGSTYFNVVAGKISKGSDHEIIVTGSSKNQSIVIDFLNFTPKINVEYNIGKFDTSNIAKLTASYITEDQKIFYADGTNGSAGTVKIAKFTSGNIQGVFQFTGVNTLNSSEKSVIRNGMFNAKLKNY